VEVDLMVFDLDGTLVRSGEDIAAAVNHTLQSLGLSPLESNTIQGFVGDGIQVLIERALGPHGMDRIARAMQLFADHYTEHLLDHTTLYPDVTEVLDHFHNKKKVIITNKREHYSKRIAQGLGIDSRFLEILGEGSTPYQKPDPRLLNLVMEKWGVAPQKTIVIGDGVNDILLARQAGALSCAFLGGLTAKEALLSLSPNLTCKALGELRCLLQ
jgi:phosphoglycolate phosphatase